MEIGAAQKCGYGKGDWKGKGKGKGNKGYNPTKGKNGCTVCGVPGHTQKECRFKDRTCNICGKKGHLKKVCNRREGQKQPHAGMVCEEDDDNEDEWYWEPQVRGLEDSQSEWGDCLEDSDDDVWRC